MSIDTYNLKSRYKLLKCYNDGKKIPAYIAFRASLDLILGKPEAERICNHLAAGGGDIVANITAYNFNKLVENDAIKKNKNLGRCFGQDLMRGEHTVGETASLKGGLTHGTTIHHYDGNQSEETQSGTSIFDPVLCEIAYRWFCPSGGKIIDPFAGGSVRGVVAAFLGYDYTGIDLSERQLKANRKQAAEILGDRAKPKWIHGDSSNVAALAPGEYDLFFTCPPYGDLEVYSEDAADLSTMPHADFIAAYRKIIAAGVIKLKPNRFAVIVVGDFRGRDGFYRNFVSDTIKAFQDADALLYNEAILVTAVGSLPIRTGRAFSSGRKMGKTHQQFLVFYKGDPKAIKNEFPSVEVELPESESK